VEDPRWAGGAIELLIFLGRGPRSLSDVLADLWAWPPLDGPYSDRLMTASADLSPEAEPGCPLYGSATLPSGPSVPFASYPVVDDDGAWIYAGVPVAGLGEAYPVGAYPFEASATEPWVLEVHAWLEGLASHVFVKTEIYGGVIGWLTTVDVEEVLQGATPEPRFNTYIATRDGRLSFQRPNTSAPLMT